MKRGFGICAGMSLALHAALAIGWSPAPARVDRVAAAAAPRALEARLTRLAPAVASPLPAASPPAAERSAAPQAAEPPATAAPPLPTTPPADPSADAARPTAAEVEHAAGPGEPEGAMSGLDAYVARPQLSIAPRPLEPILLGYPADGPALGRFVATLTLYIDEDGWVRRVDLAADASLPATLRQAAHDAFAGQRFTPGEVAGRVVKSRIRVEAVYESTLLPSLVATAAADTASPP